MKSNLRVRVYENINLFGKHYKRAVSFNFRMTNDKNESDRARELYITPWPDHLDFDGVAMQCGNGHVRMDVRASFAEDLGTEKPDFERVWEFYSALAVKPIKDFIYSGARRW